MGQSISKVLVHITFSTKYRQVLIDNEIEEKLYAYLGGICKKLKCNPIIVGGHKNHVHILCLLSRNITQADLLEEIKKSSSKWAKTVSKKYENFYWQNGYGIFSVNPSEAEVVVNYIKNQKKHHSKRTWEDEFLAFLKRYGVDYDDRYIWD